MSSTAADGDKVKRPVTYTGRLVPLDGSVDEIGNDARAADQDTYAPSVKRGPDCLVRVNFPDVGIVDHAWFTGTVGHRDTPRDEKRQPQSNDRGPS